MIENVKTSKEINLRKSLTTPSRSLMPIADKNILVFLPRYVKSPNVAKLSARICERNSINNCLRTE